MNKLLQCGELSSCNSRVTPMENRLKFRKLSTAEAMNAIEYRRIIGTLWYLLHTRSDTSTGSWRNRVRITSLR
jgi:hypothetical protein